MKKPITRGKVLAWGVVLCTGVAVGPYLYGRVMARASAVSVEVIGPEANPAIDSSLRIGTFNIAHGRGAIPGGPNMTDESPVKRTDRLKAIAKLIRDESLDVVVLNEVDFDCYWSHGIDQSEVIAKAAGLPYILKQRNADILIPFRTLRFGNAVISRHPITEGKLLKLPALKKWEDILGGAHDSAVCVITLPDGNQVKVLPVHLEVRDQATRIAGVETIASAVSQSNQPSLILGDFNSYPSASSPDAISTLTEKTGLSPMAGTGLNEPNFTFPSSKPNRRLDWIFVPASWQVRSWKIHSTNLSDHSFVTAILDRSPTPSE